MAGLTAAGLAAAALDFAPPAGFAAVPAGARVVAGLAAGLPPAVALPTAALDAALPTAFATVPLRGATLAGAALADGALADAALPVVAFAATPFVAAPFAAGTFAAATDFPALEEASERTPLFAGLSDEAGLVPDCLLTFARVLDPVAVDFLMLTLNPFGKLGARPGASRGKEPDSLSRLVTQ